MSKETKKVVMNRTVNFGESVKIGLSLEMPKDVDEFVLSNLYSELLHITKEAFETEPQKGDN